MSHARKMPESVTPPRYIRIVMPEVSVSGSKIHIRDLVVDDSALARTLASIPEGERVEAICRIIEVGWRGMNTMGTGVALNEVDETVRRSVETATAEVESTVRTLLEDASRQMAETFDPEQRSSLVARTIDDLSGWKDEFLGSVDPRLSDSHTGLLLGRLDSLLGPNGALEERLLAALDPASEESAFARLLGLVDRRFTEVREILAEGRGRQEEAAKGTSKGLTYEDDLESTLREASRPLGIAVERTSRQPGAAGGDAMVGDFVLHYPHGLVAVEAKNSASITLTGKDGILAELDRAMANRQATVGICVSATNAFPAEVGSFGVYGNRILVVDEADGLFVRLAMKWAAALLDSSLADRFEPDAAVIGEKLQRLRHLAQLFTSNKRALTDINGSVDKVKNSMELMRSDLLAIVDDIAMELGRSADGAEVVSIKTA